MILTEEQKKIKELWGQVEYKRAIVEKLCNEFGLKPKAMNNNWFCDSGYWAVTISRRSRVIEVLEETIKNQ